MSYHLPAGGGIPATGDLMPASGPEAPGAVRAASGGLAPDVAVLFREQHADLVRLAVLLVGDRPSAEDVVQDVFTRLCLRGRLPAGNGSVAYVRAAVLNGCRSALRRRAVARRFRISGQSVVRDALQDSAENEVILADDRRQVLAALAVLPPRRREVLVLRYWLGLTEAEIASVLGVSTGTVKSTAARALAALARKLGEQA